MSYSKISQFKIPKNLFHGIFRKKFAKQNFKIFVAKKTKISPIKKASREASLYATSLAWILPIGLLVVDIADISRI